MTFFETLLGTVNGSRNLALNSSNNEATCPTGEYWIVYRTDNQNVIISTSVPDNAKAFSGLRNSAKGFQDLKPFSLGGGGFVMPGGRAIILEPGEILQSYCTVSVGTAFTISWTIYRFAKVSV